MDEAAAAEFGSSPRSASATAPPSVSYMAPCWPVRAYAKAKARVPVLRQASSGTPWRATALRRASSARRRPRAR